MINQKTMKGKAISIQDAHLSINEILLLVKNIHTSIDPNGIFESDDIMVRMGAIETTEIITFMFTVAINISTGVMASIIYDHLKKNKINDAKLSIDINKDMISIETKEFRININSDNRVN